MATVLDIVTGALKELGVLAAGEVPTAVDAADCLTGLNNLIDQFATERLTIYTVTRSTWTIVSGTQVYTVGTGGTVNIARPVYVEHVNYQDTSATPVLEYQLQPMTDDAWSKLPQRALTSVRPTNWYSDYAHPLANLSLWPVPTSATLQGVIYAATAVPEFAALSQSVALPPGYRRMLIKNLAVEMAPSYDRADTQDSPMTGGPRLLAQQAREAKDAVKRANKRLMDMSIDAAALVQGRSRTFSYNINTG
jgi:hypothetical protein